MTPHPLDRPRKPTPRLLRFLTLDAQSAEHARPHIHKLRRARRPAFSDLRLRRFLGLARRAD